MFKLLRGNGQRRRRFNFYAASYHSVNLDTDSTDDTDFFILKFPKEIIRTNQFRSEKSVFNTEITLSKLRLQ